VGFEVLTGVVIFWDIMLCNLLKVICVSEENVSSVFRVEGSACYPLHAGFLLGFFFDAEDGGDMCLQIIS
jgi:hypothetical protein